MLTGIKFLSVGAANYLVTNDGHRADARNRTGHVQARLTCRFNCSFHELPLMRVHRWASEPGPAN